jgi:hypothetical protein
VLPLSRVFLFIFVAVLLVPARAHAEEEAAPESVTTVYSEYEKVAIKQAEQLFKTTVDPEPEGKIIESIETLRLDPIEERDPAPVALNAAHITTKEDVVKHEILLHVGEPYKKVLADESARNLRRFAYMTIIIAVPLRGSRADRVRLVMITKDVWSLIADVDVDISSGGPEEMMFEIEENNVAGRQFGIATRTVIQPESYSLGADLAAPRFAGHFLSFHTEGNVIINRRSGEPEGSWGDARVERPLFSTRTPWGWGVSSNWDDRIFRRYTNAKVATFAASNGSEVPFLWRSRRIEQTAFVTRSIGWAHKNDFTLGLSAVHDVYHAPNVDDLDPIAVKEFTKAVVPVGETRVHPYAQWRTYGNDFLRILDFETLGLQEDYRLGYDVVFKGYPVLRAVGSSRNLLGTRLGASYTIKMGDGFVRGIVDTVTELQFGVGDIEPVEGKDRPVDDTNIADGSWHAEIRLVSPRTPLGRLVWDIDALNRYRNFLNRISQVGGEDRLRGWPTRHFVGKNTFNMNLEWRTRPIELFSVMLGGALFYDVGKAFNGGFDQITPAQSVGFGFRVVLPQIDRMVLRGDFGFPVAMGDLPADVAPMSFFFSFGQAFKIAHQPAPLGP